MAVPVRCYQQKDGNLLAQFTPPFPGGYRIDVLYDGKPLRGSPFTCQAYDPSKVSIGNVRNTNVSVHETISFQSKNLCNENFINDKYKFCNLIFAVKKRDAGLASIDVTVATPFKDQWNPPIPLEVKALPNDEGDLVEFYPTVSGKYRFSVLFGEIPIPGQSLIISCSIKT
jgi:filamin